MLHCKECRKRCNRRNCTSEQHGQPWKTIKSSFIIRYPHRFFFPDFNVLGPGNRPSLASECRPAPRPRSVADQLLGQMGGRENNRGTGWCINNTLIYIYIYICVCKMINEVGDTYIYIYKYGNMSIYIYMYSFSPMN